VRNNSGMRGSAETRGALGDFEGESSGAEAAEPAELSPKQAREVAYRFLARYYDFERTVPIRRVLEVISTTGSVADAWAASELWKVSVQETLDGVPLPDLPAPWEA
jgi:hypothetical protein